MQTKKRPNLVERREPSHKTLDKHNYTTIPLRRKQSLDDYNLPSPVDYYGRIFPDLSTSQDWATVICPFHDDHHPSLSINLNKGCFKCHSCGAKGGGITKFHMMKYNLPFKETIKQLEGGRW
ncbi:uncharacterized protein METZ01_LOCUS443558 [marine metagenome]|uniref:Zinc finger CHC2-type domain-containing protein n=1 Tax=marine metagenome TaxID=408172 RepID=A0A382Z5C5_9ZZZZ